MDVPTPFDGDTTIESKKAAFLTEITGKYLSNTHNFHHHIRKLYLSQQLDYLVENYLK